MLPTKDDIRARKPKGRCIPLSTAPPCSSLLISNVYSLDPRTSLQAIARTAVMQKLKDQARRR